MNPTASPPLAARQETVDAVVVGAGFAGLYAVHQLRALGLSVRGIEAGSDVGGTWYWNRYPGARCDAVSALYSFSFDDDLQQEWSWSEKYATQGEIQHYLAHVADRFDLRDRFWFDTRVASAVFDEVESVWTLTAESGDTVTARWCVMGTGCLSQPKLPEIPGVAETTLRVLHTGAWPAGEVDFTGLRVGVIGTGSSGIQAIPLIAKQAAQLTVFQRTPAFTVPAHNAATDPADERYLKANYAGIREAWRQGRLLGAGEPLHPDGAFRSTVKAFDVSAEERDAEFRRRWRSGGPFFNGSFADIVLDQRANDAAADFVRARIDDVVTDPETAAKLKPRDYPIGAKRLAVDTDFWATFNRDNVTLVDLRQDPLERVTDTGVRTASGEVELDVLVCATGYDAMTGALLAMDIRGRDGLRLADAWAAGPTNYLGLAVAGFPNLFTITGPGSPSVLGNVVGNIEQHVEWVRDLIADSRERGVEVVEAERPAQQAWVEQVNANAAATLYPRAASWYLGANVPGKPRVFMPFVGGIGLYRPICEDVVARGYAGFSRTPVPAPV